MPPTTSSSSKSRLSGTSALKIYTLNPDLLASAMAFCCWLFRSDCRVFTMHRDLWPLILSRKSNISGQVCSRLARTVSLSHLLDRWKLFSAEFSTYQSRLIYGYLEYCSFTTSTAPMILLPDNLRSVNFQSCSVKYLCASICPICSMSSARRFMLCSRPFYK